MNFESIKTILDDALENHCVPCSDIAVSVNNQPVYRYMNGTGDDRRSIHIRGDELYFLYSATKPITCTAALQLYERGMIGLDDDVADYLPEYKNVCVKTADGTRPARNQMKIRHLFTMTSGMNYDLNCPAIREQIQRKTDSTTLELVRAMAESPLEFEPGEHFQYGLSHDVLAAIIELVSGVPFGEYLQKNIFDVCGMRNTFVGCNDRMKDRLCSKYRYDALRGCLELTEKENQFILTANYQSGGAGLVSCVEDYMRFAGELVNGERLLRRSTVDLMRTGQLSGAAHEDFQKCKAGYSYGLGVRTNVEGKFSAKGEFGWDGAAGAYVMLDPDNHLAVFYATHIGGHGDYLYGVLHLALRDAVYDGMRK